MSELPKPPQLIRASDRAALPERVFKHPLNPASEVHLRSLGDAVGMKRLGLHVIRVPPGKESFVYHAHYTEEEFVYILSGRGLAEIGDEVIEVGPGDFMGFPTPSVGHHLLNPFDEELVYLAGGERHTAEISDFPKLGKRVVRAGWSFSVHTIADAEGYPGIPRVGVETPR